MADVDQDDKKTLDQSNSGESDDQTDDSVVDNQQQDDQDQSGQADDQGDDSGDDAQDDSAEGDKKTRGEVRHERYIDKLASEIRQSNQQATDYTKEIFAPKPYEPLKYQDGEDYDPKQLEEDRKTVADNKFAEGMQQGVSQGSQQFANELWADRFELDADRVTTRFADIADDPKLEASLVQKYIKFTGMEKDPQSGRISIQRPNVRFKDFVEAEMQEREEYASRKAANSQQNLVSQAAKTGVRPSGQSRTSKGGHGFDPQDPAGSVARITKDNFFELGGKEASDAYLAKRGLST